MKNEMVYDGFNKIEMIQATIKGKTVQREKLHVKSAVAAVITDGDGRIALVKQYRPVIDQTTYEIPAGVLDKPGKTKESTLLEELEEECNISVNDLTVTPIMEFYMIPGISDAKLYLYRVKSPHAYKSKPVMDNDVDAVVWVTFEQFNTLVEAGEIVENKTRMAHFVLSIEALTRTDSHDAMTKLEQLIESLKRENPHVQQFNCLNCSHSFSTNTNQLICVATTNHKNVNDDHLCKDFC